MAESDHDLVPSKALDLRLELGVLHDLKGPMPLFERRRVLFWPDVLRRQWRQPA